MGGEREVSCAHNEEIKREIGIAKTHHEGTTYLDIGKIDAFLIRSNANLNRIVHHSFDSNHNLTHGHYILANRVL